MSSASTTADNSTNVSPTNSKARKSITTKIWDHPNSTSRKNSTAKEKKPQPKPGGQWDISTTINSRKNSTSKPRRQLPEIHNDEMKPQPKLGSQWDISSSLKSTLVDSSLPKKPLARSSSLRNMAVLTLRKFTGTKKQRGALFTRDVYT